MRDSFNNLFLCHSISDCQTNLYEQKQATVLSIGSHLYGSSPEFLFKAASFQFQRPHTLINPDLVSQTFFPKPLL